MSIKVENLTYIYDEGMPFEHRALDDVSFEIQDRDFVGLIGHTGSGKSTLIQAINPSREMLHQLNMDDYLKNNTLVIIERKDVIYQVPTSVLHIEDCC